MKDIKKYSKALIILAFTTLPNFASIDSDSQITFAPIQVKQIEYIHKSDFLYHIAFKESSNRYNVSNQLNMLGKYQASRRALLDFGYSNEHIDSIHSTIYTDTLSSGRVVYYFETSLFPPSEQERFIGWYLSRIEQIYLRDIIEQYVGQEVDGIYITKAGILFASMLGFRHVQQYLESEGQIDFNDANGTSIKNRLSEFDAIELAS